MKVLCARPGPAFSVQDVHAGWVRAFQKLGCEVGDLNLDERLTFYTQAHVEKDGEFVKAMPPDKGINLAAKGLETACYEFWPDIVFITSCFFIPRQMLQLMRERGHKVVILHTESPYEDDRQLQRAPFADLNLINDPTNLERFRTMGPTEYQPHCYDPDFHHPREPDPDLLSDFCFVGTGYPSRVEFFEQVDWTGIDFALGGHWSSLAPDSPLRDFVVHPIEHCMDNTETVQLYAAAKMSANLYRIEAERPELSEGWSMGPREIELAACGVPFLRQPRGEGDDILSFVPTFDSPGDFGEKLRWYLANEGAREVLAEKAREAIADRTFENAARRLLARLS